MVMVVLVLVLVLVVLVVLSCLSNHHYYLQWGQVQV
jgi:hypothetical protein